MRRIKSFKLFENKDITLEDILPKDILQDLWVYCRDLDYFDKGYGLKIQAYVEKIEDELSLMLPDYINKSMNRSEWILDTTLTNEEKPDGIDYEFLMRQHVNFNDVRELYLEGGKTYLRFGIISAHELLLNETNKLYDIFEEFGDNELDKYNIELVKLGYHNYQY